MDKELLILDGGLGTTLEDLYNVKFSQDTPLWSSHLLVSSPATLAKVQNDFSQAGVDILLTPTYQASHVGFRKTRPGISDHEISQYFCLAVKISRSCKPDGLVALSLGAYGAVLQPSQEFSGNYGDVDQNGLADFHRERLAACNISEIDLIAFETIPRLDEVRAVKELMDGSKPFWISCVFPNGKKLPDGSTIEEVLSVVMSGTRPWGIGINCTKIARIASLVEEFEDVASKLRLKLPRLVLYPDGTNGQVYDTAQQAWVGEDQVDDPWHQKMYRIITDIRQRAQWEGYVVGGCCKTLPEHIRQLRRLLAPEG